MANIELPDVPSREGSPFQTTMAILIAVVTVVGALIAWRTAVLSEQAANADFTGIVTVVRNQEAQTTSSAQAYQRYRAYTDFVINRAIADELETALQDFENDVVFTTRLLEARNAQANNSQYFQSVYVTETGYNVERDVKTGIANAGQRQPLDPTPFYAEADATRDRAGMLVQTFIILGVALFAFSFAEALHKDRRLLRYTLALIGLVAMVSSIVLAVMNEVS